MGIKGFLDPVGDAYIVVVLMGCHASPQGRQVDDLQPDSSADSTKSLRNPDPLTSLQIVRELPATQRRLAFEKEGVSAAAA
ncbi:hypothetical protein F4806DRAFT_444195 [Annulohypoxylon nitens]|nr:hypothetical protein F4806DRAFT_444195 [Annulohypoxylon nitens]